MQHPGAYNTSSVDPDTNCHLLHPTALLNIAFHTLVTPTLGMAQPTTKGLRLVATSTSPTSVRLVKLNSGGLVWFSISLSGTSPTALTLLLLLTIGFYIIRIGTLLLWLLGGLSLPFPSFINLPAVYLPKCHHTLPLTPALSLRTIKPSALSQV